AGVSAVHVGRGRAGRGGTAHLHAPDDARAIRNRRRSVVADGEQRTVAQPRPGAVAHDDVGEPMKRTKRVGGAACVALGATTLIAQQVRPAPRPPAQAPGPPRPEDGSAAPDGYAPIPEWPGQTRAPKASKIAEYNVETVAEGLNGAFCFDF